MPPYTLNKSTDHFNEIFQCIFDILEIGEERTLEKLNEIHVQGVQTKMNKIMNQADGFAHSQIQKDCMTKLTDYHGLPSIEAPTRLQQIQACIMLLVAIKSLVKKNMGESPTTDAVQQACQHLVKVLFNYGYEQLSAPVATRMVELLVGLYMLGPAWIATQWIMNQPPRRPASEAYPGGQTLKHMFGLEKGEYDDDACVFVVEVIPGHPAKFDLVQLVKEACPSNSNEVTKESVRQSATECHAAVAQFATVRDIQELVPDLQAMSKIVQSQLNVLFANMRMDYTWKVLKIQVQIIEIVDNNAANTARSKTAKAAWDAAQAALTSARGALTSATDERVGADNTVAALKLDIANLKSQLETGVVVKGDDYAGTLSSAVQNAFVAFVRDPTTVNEELKQMADSGEFGQNQQYQLYTEGNGKVGAGMKKVADAKAALAAVEVSADTAVVAKYKELKGDLETAMSHQADAHPDTGNGKRGRDTDCLEDAGYTTESAGALLEAEQQAEQAESDALTAKRDKEAAMQKTASNASSMAGAVATVEISYKQNGKGNDVSAAIAAAREAMVNAEQDVRLVDQLAVELDKVMVDTIDRVPLDPEFFNPNPLSFDGTNAASADLKKITDDIAALDIGHDEATGKLETDLKGEEKEIGVEESNAQAVVQIWSQNGIDGLVGDDVSEEVKGKYAAAVAFDDEIQTLLDEDFGVGYVSFPPMSPLYGPSTMRPLGKTVFEKDVADAKSTRTLEVEKCRDALQGRLDTMNGALKTLTDNNDTAKENARVLRADTVDELGSFCETGANLTDAFLNRLPQGAVDAYANTERVVNQGSTYYQSAVGAAKATESDEQEKCREAVSKKEADKKKAWDDKTAEISTLDSDYATAIQNMETDEAADQATIRCDRDIARFVQSRVCKKHGSVATYYSDRTEDSAFAKDGEQTTITDEMKEYLEGVIQEVQKSEEELIDEKAGLVTQKGTLNEQLAALKAKGEENGSIRQDADDEKADKKIIIDGELDKKTNSVTGSIAKTKKDCEEEAERKIGVAETNKQNAIAAHAAAVIARNTKWTQDHAQNVIQHEADKKAAQDRIAVLNGEIDEVQSANIRHAEELSDMSDSIKAYVDAADDLAGAYKLGFPNDDQGVLQEALSIAKEVSEADQAKVDHLKAVMENEANSLAVKRAEITQKEQVIATADAYFVANGKTIEDPQNAEHKTQAMEKATTDEAKADQDKKDAEDERDACATTAQAATQAANQAHADAISKANGLIEAEMSRKLAANSAAISAKEAEISEKQGEIDDKQGEIDALSIQCAEWVAADKANPINAHFTSAKKDREDKLSTDKSAAEKAHNSARAEMVTDETALKKDYDDYVKPMGGGAVEQAECYAEAKKPVTDAEDALSAWNNRCASLKGAILDILDDAIEKINEDYETAKEGKQDEIEEFTMDDGTRDREMEECELEQDRLVMIATDILSSWENHVASVERDIEQLVTNAIDSAREENAGKVNTANSAYSKARAALVVKRTQQELENQAVAAYVATVGVTFAKALQNAIAAVLVIDQNALKVLDDALQERTAEHSAAETEVVNMHSGIMACLNANVDNAMDALMLFMRPAPTKQSHKMQSWWSVEVHLYGPDGTTFVEGSGAAAMYANALPAAQSALSTAELELGSTRDAFHAALKSLRDVAFGRINEKESDLLSAENVAAQKLIAETQASNAKATAVQTEANAQTNYNTAVAESAVPNIVDALNALRDIRFSEIENSSGQLLKRMAFIDNESPDNKAQARLDNLLRDLRDIFTASYDQIEPRLPALVSLAKHLQSQISMLAQSVSAWA